MNFVFLKIYVIFSEFTFIPVDYDLDEIGKVLLFDFDLSFFRKQKKSSFVMKFQRACFLNNFDFKIRNIDFKCPTRPQKIRSIYE